MSDLIVTIIFIAATALLGLGAAYVGYVLAGVRHMDGERDR